MLIKAVLIYPEIPATYWSFRYALPFIAKKASMPPIGLLTVAALLPDDYEVRLIDLNVSQLKKQDIMEADIVMTSSMILQKKSLEDIIQLCNHLGKPVIAGGPYPTISYNKIKGVNHFVLNEAEITLPQFLHDYHVGKAK
ncbi:MAG: cobalamin-dependent protein, partial [bacterium]